MQEAPIPNAVSPGANPDKLSFVHWPPFARFIREHHMREYAEELLRLSREADLPIMKLIAHIPEEQLIEMTIQGHGEFLDKVAENVLRAHLDEGLKKWEENKLEIISNDEIATEDITVGTFIRKKALLKLLPHYTTDPFEIIAIVKEIDTFDTTAATESVKLHFNILKNKIEEQLYFIEKISNTTPGLTYVVDIANNKIKYANQNYQDFFGYTLEEIEALGETFMDTTIHAEDIARTHEVMELIPQMSNNDQLTLENRLKNSKGKYKWMRHYFSIFKRDGNSNPVEVIGIVLDIENEKRASQQLAHREEQLLEAQAIGDIGSFEWHFDDIGKTHVTPQLLKIFCLDEVAAFPDFIEYIHPSDRRKVQDAIEKAKNETGVYECEYRYEKNDIEKIIWSRGIIIYKDGKAAGMKGAIMDVTERNHMIHRLQRSEDLYKQAQALSHMGNYAYDIKHNRITWTDEIYRIFGLEPQSTEIDLEMFMSFVHPEDKEMTRQNIEKSITHKKPHNFYYRILLHDGTEKILQAIGEVLEDENGVVYKFVGTAQDVTEKQRLIENLQLAQAMSHIGNWAWDLATNEIHWSDEMFRIYNLEVTPGAMYRNDFIYLRHPDDIPKVENHIKLLLETHEPQEYYYRSILKDGSVRTLHARAEVKIDKDGKPVQVFGTVQDVTEKQQMIEQLQDSTALYMQAQTMAHIGNWTWDVVNDEVHWSEEVFRIYEVPYREGKLDRTFTTSLRHPEDADMVSEMIHQVIDTRSQREYQYRIITGDGKVKILNAITEPIINENGEVHKVIGTIQDVTEKQLIEQQVRANQAFIQKIADTAPSIITAYNVNTGKYNFVSEGLQKLLGYEPDLAIEHGIQFFMERIHPEDLATLMAQNNAVMEEANLPENADEQIVEEFTYRVLHADGQYRWLHTYGTVFDRNEEGKIEHVLNISVDITDQIQADIALQQKNIQLQQSNSSLQDYAYVASHDLKEPLRKISTFSDRLLTSQKDRLTEDGQIYLKKIVDSAKRMQVMISDLLSVSMISGNKAYENYSLQSILDEVKQVLEYKIEEKQATITSEHLPDAFIVPSQFRQLFQNLISNSLKFAPVGKKPVIQIACGYLKPQDVAHLELEKTGKYLQLSFSDNGIGFDNQYSEKIFTIFQRLHGRSEYEGTGIGLAICKKIAENHGGTIFANGNLNQGATFTIIIPV